MCASVIVDPAGKPVRVTAAVPSTLAMLLEASRVTTNVTVTLPEADCSVLLTGLGASLLGFSCAVNVTVSPGAVGVVAGFDDDLQPAATKARTMIRVAYFIGWAP